MKEKPLSKRSLRAAVERAAENVQVVDVHTHLFPSSTQLYLSGFIDLLNYHYLTAEYLNLSTETADEFENRSAEERARRIWEMLFCEQTPVSEAALGIITTLHAHKIRPSGTFDEISKKYSAKTSQKTELDHLNLAGVSHVAMTNNPFDSKEWSIFNGGTLPAHYLASLRLDDLFYKGIKLESTLEEFLKARIHESNARYMGISGSYDQLEEIFKDTDKITPILKVSEDRDIPVALFAGVIREANPSYRSAGDGVKEGSIQWIASVARTHPRCRFYITCLSEGAQYELHVLARNFPNIIPFGCWWYLNTPQSAGWITRQRMELLGTSFIPQFSDARIMDQLTYKWRHFRAVISELLIERYEQLADYNFSVTKSAVKKDLETLLRTGPARMLGIHMELQ